VNATIESPAPSILINEKIIAALKKSGPLTIEEMSSIPGMSWVRVFSAVDRLSRIGAVSLRRVGLAYQVVYNQTILSQSAAITKTSTPTAKTLLQQA
jgi:hypothetical protein